MFTFWGLIKYMLLSEEAVVVTDNSILVTIHGTTIERPSHVFGGDIIDWFRVKDTNECIRIELM